MCTVVDVQHDTKRGWGYYEATCAKAGLGSDGKWKNLHGQCGWVGLISIDQTIIPALTWRG
jgi:hypothetical protein